MDPLSLIVGFIILIIAGRWAMSGGDVLTDIKLVHTSNFLHVGEVEVWSKEGKKIPLVGAKATQHKLYGRGTPAKVIDGNHRSINHTQKATPSKPQWLNIRLGVPIPVAGIGKIVVWNRPGGLRRRLNGAKLHAMSGSTILKTYDFAGSKAKYNIQL